MSVEPGHSYYGALVAMRQVRVAIAKRSIRQGVDLDTEPRGARLMCAVT